MILGTPSVIVLQTLICTAVLVRFVDVSLQCNDCHMGQWVIEPLGRLVIATITSIIICTVLTATPACNYPV